MGKIKNTIQRLSVERRSFIQNKFYQITEQINEYVLLSNLFSDDEQLKLLLKDLDDQIQFLNKQKKIIAGIKLPKRVSRETAIANKHFNFLNATPNQTFEVPTFGVSNQTFEFPTFGDPTFGVSNQTFEVPTFGVSNAAPDTNIEINQSNSDSNKLFYFPSPY